jgi:hypothetical protein
VAHRIEPPPAVRRSVKFRGFQLLDIISVQFVLSDKL